MPSTLLLQIRRCGQLQPCRLPFSSTLPVPRKVSVSFVGYAFHTVSGRDLQEYKYAAILTQDVVHPSKLQIVPHAVTQSRLQLSFCDSNPTCLFCFHFSLARQRLNMSEKAQDATKPRAPVRRATTNSQTVGYFNRRSPSPEDLIREFVSGMGTDQFGAMVIPPEDFFETPCQSVFGDGQPSHRIPQASQRCSLSHLSEKPAKGSGSQKDTLVSGASTGQSVANSAVDDSRKEQDEKTRDTCRMQ